MSIPTLVSDRPIRLQFALGRIDVSPEDEGRFASVSHMAVTASHLEANGIPSSTVFGEKFLVPLREWCQSHVDRVEHCYMPLELTNDFIKVFVVRRALKFDFALSDALSDLDCKLVDEGWPCEVLQIGPGSTEELRGYFAPEDSIQVF